MRKPLFAAVLALVSAQAAFADACSVDITANDQMQFDKSAITVPKSCKTFKVNLIHGGKLPKAVMGHNWVLSEAASVQGIATDGMAAGVASNFVKPGDSRVIASTKVIGGGEKDSVSIPVAKLHAGTDYAFFCSFPGHSSVMKGTLALAK